MIQCKDKHTLKAFHHSSHTQIPTTHKKQNEQSTANSHSYGQTCTVLPRMPENDRDVGKLFSISLLGFTVSNPLSY